jgi:hypothetical protein
VISKALHDPSSQANHISTRREQPPPKQPPPKQPPPKQPPPKQPAPKQPPPKQPAPKQPVPQNPPKQSMEPNSSCKGRLSRRQCLKTPLEFELVCDNFDRRGNGVYADRQATVPRDANAPIIDCNRITECDQNRNVVPAGQSRGLGNLQGPTAYALCRARCHCIDPPHPRPVRK